MCILLFPIQIALVPACLTCSETSFTLATAFLRGNWSNSPGKKKKNQSVWRFVAAKLNGRGYEERRLEMFERVKAAWLMQ